MRFAVIRRVASGRRSSPPKTVTRAPARSPRSAAHTKLTKLVCVGLLVACSASDRDVSPARDGSAGAPTGGAAGVAGGATGGVAGVATGGAGGVTGGSGGGAGVTLSAEFSWQTGQSPVDLGTGTLRFCFVTALSGSFGPGSAVSVTMVGQNWQLSGVGSSVVSGRARCINWTVGDKLQASPEFSWKPGEPRVNLGVYPGRACALTGVGGTLSTPNDAVRVYVESGATWFLDGGGAGTQASGRAHCLLADWATPMTLGPPVTWYQTDGAKLLAPVTSTACFLSHVGGSIGTAGEGVEIYQQGQVWWLVGGSQNPGIAGAHCVGYVCGGCG